MLVVSQGSSITEMVSTQFREESFPVRRRQKGLGIAGPCVYHWLLKG